MMSALLFIVSTAVSTPPDLWPLPKSVSSGTSTITVTASDQFFKASGQKEQGPLLTEAFSRYTQYTFPHKAKAGERSLLTTLTVSVDSPDESHPQLDTDESYTLEVSADSATLHAKTVYGALRGLETFSQLVRFDFDSETYSIDGAPYTISDAPRFAHRGLMIDSARHFQPLASIRGIIDSLPFAKINTLHWHLVDTQSFPFHSETNPKLWDGAYDERSKYTHSDIASIVEYARKRGVRVMPEFDMPGHAQSWCVGYPELCPSTTCTTPLDVSNNFTFALIDRLLAECTARRASTPGHPAGLFPEQLLHLGGDEVSTDCWESTPRIAAWLKAHKFSADDGYAYFVKNTAAIAMAQKRRPVQWSEVYDHFKTQLPPEVIVHVWKSVTNVTEVVANGYDVIRNVGYDATSWYLDNLNVDCASGRRP
jgi:hexosaminidase